MTSLPADAARLRDKIARVVRADWPLALLLVLAMLHVAWLYRVTQGWVVDDAYISFRYAENWVDGKGLVFNAGERVEGYTNFLWVLLLAAGYAARLPTPALAQALGVLLSFGAVTCLYFTGKHLMSRRLGVGAAALYALNHSLMSWSFGGLELPLFVFLALLGTYLLHVRGSPWALVAFAGTALTRPDGYLFLLIGFVFVWLPTGPTAGNERRLAASLCAATFVAAQLGFKLAYYHALLPNTFHAKVGFHAQQLARGYDYVFDMADRYVALLPAVMLLPFARGPSNWRWYLLSALVGYAAFVVYSGGDPHPGFRLAMPLLPFAWLALATLLWSWRRRAPFSTLCLWAALFVNDAWQGLPLLPEGAAYAHFRTDKVGPCGEKIGRWLDEHAPPGALIATNTAGSIPYFAKRLGAIDMLGLTDATIARKNRRVGKGYVGHEAHDAKYVLARRPDYIFLCFSCNTSGPCLDSDRALVSQKRFTDGYQRNEASSKGLKFFYYTPMQRAEGN